MGNSFSELELCVGPTPKPSSSTTGQPPLASGRRSKREPQLDSSRSSKMSLPQFNDQRVIYTPDN